MPSSRGGLHDLVKNATGATPMLHKLWFISGRELQRLGTESDRGVPPVRINWVYPFQFLETEGLVRSSDSD